MRDDIIDVEVVVDGTAAVAQASFEVTPSGGKRPVKRDYHASMRYGLQMMNLWLEQKGFRCNCVEQSSVSISVEKRGFMFDIKIWPLKKSNIAFVTSGIGYVYDPKKINAKVTKLNEVLPDCDYVIQVIGSRESTVPPVYIPMPRKVDEDPGVFMARSILNTLNVLAKELAKQGKGQLKEELAGVEELDFDKLSAVLDKVPEEQLKLSQAVPENSPHAP